MGKLLTRHDYMDRLDVNFSHHLVRLTEKKSRSSKSGWVRFEYFTIISFLLFRWDQR